MFAHAIVGAVNLAVECEQKRDGVFGYSVRRIRGHANDGEAKRLGRRQINIIESRAAQRHEPDASGVKLLQARGVEPVVDENANGLRTVHAGGSLAGEAEFVELAA